MKSSRVGSCSASTKGENVLNLENKNDRGKMKADLETDQENYKLLF